MKLYQLESIKRQLGMFHANAIDSIGNSGGLALVWNNKVDVSFKTSSKNHIDVVVGEVNGGEG